MLEFSKDWSFTDDQSKVTKLFKFDDFDQAIQFVNKVALIAGSHNHHPDILIEYNKVTLTLWTHSAGTVTEKDQNLAQEIDQL